MNKELKKELEDLFGCDDMMTGHHHECVRPRQLAYVIYRLKYKYRLREIAELFNCHHSTVIHGMNVIADMIKFDEGFYDFTAEIIEKYEIQYSEIFKQRTNATT